MNNQPTASGRNLTETRYSGRVIARPMNILIAGGAGFIGLNLAEAILRSGEHVVIYDPGAVPGAAQRTLDGLPGS